MEAAFLFLLAWSFSIMASQIVVVLSVIKKGENEDLAIHG